jgi:ribosomal protein L37AE/L43A
MEHNIQEIANEKDIKCPICGNSFKKIISSNSKSIFECIKCGYKIN